MFAFLIPGAIVLLVVVSLIKSYNPLPVEERPDFNDAFKDLDDEGHLKLIKLDEYEEETYHFPKN